MPHFPLLDSPRAIAAFLVLAAIVGLLVALAARKPKSTDIDWETGEPPRTGKQELH